MFTSVLPQCYLSFTSFLPHFNPLLGQQSRSTVWKPRFTDPWRLRLGECLRYRLVTSRSQNSASNKGGLTSHLRILISGVWGLKCLAVIPDPPWIPFLGVRDFFFPFSETPEPPKQQTSNGILQQKNLWIFHLGHSWDLLEILEFAEKFQKTLHPGVENYCRMLPGLRVLLLYFCNFSCFVGVCVCSSVPKMSRARLREENPCFSEGGLPYLCTNALRFFGLFFTFSLFQGKANLARGKNNLGNVNVMLEGLYKQLRKVNITF